MIEERLKMKEMTQFQEDIQNKDMNKLDYGSTNQNFKETIKPVDNSNEMLKLAYLRNFMRNRKETNEPVDRNYTKNEMVYQTVNNQENSHKNINNRNEINGIREFIRSNESRQFSAGLNAYNNSTIAPFSIQNKNSKPINNETNRPDINRSSFNSIEGINDYVEVVRVNERNSNPIKINDMNSNPLKINYADIGSKNFMKK